MTLAYWIVFVAALLPYFVVAIAKATRSYDNADPRNPANFPDPVRKRAHAAHQNALEAFAFFAVAVLLAGLRGADAHFVNGAAIVWLIARLAYLWSYLTDRAALRSLFWFVASFAAIAIYLAALLA